MTQETFMAELFADTSLILAVVGTLMLFDFYREDHNQEEL